LVVGLSNNAGSGESTQEVVSTFENRESRTPPEDGLQCVGDTRQVAMDELTLQRDGRRRYNDPFAVQQGRHDVPN
jgi:hypothetical protein